MSTECQMCGGRADLFICGVHITEMREMLKGLVRGPRHPNGQHGPGWIELLEDAVVGQVRLGDGGQRSYASVLSLAQYTDPNDGDEKLERAVAAGAFTRDKVLAAGRVNGKASRLRDAAQNTLTTIVRNLCESRGVSVRSVRAVPPSFIGPLREHDIRCEYRGDAHLAALWLSERVLAIACDEDAGRTFMEIDNHIKAIERAINPPIPMRFLGRCPTWLDEKRAVCGTELRCRADAVEVYCRVCRQTHNPDRLQLLMINDLEREKVTIARILELNRVLPDEYRIPERTLRRWRSEGKLKPRGYIRPDGSRAINRHSEDDEPLYLWADVRKLRAQSGKEMVG